MYLRGSVSVSLRQLRAFIMVAREQNFTRAADKLGTSQSTVSGLITDLENNLGMRLFDRHTRMLSITGPGAELLPAITKVIADIDSILDTSDALRTLTRGRVTIAVSSLQAALLMPKLIEAFCADYPGVQVKLLDVSEHEVPTMVRAGTVDFGIGTEHELGLDLAALALIEDIFVAVMRPDNALARYASLRWHDVQTAQLIGPYKGNPVREHLDRALLREGITLNRIHEVYLPLTMLGMVQAGLGIAAMSTAVLPLAKAMGLTTRPLQDPEVRREVSLISLADRSLSPTAQRFHDHIWSHRIALSDF